MSEKILDAFCFVLRAIASIVAFFVILAVVILFLPIALIVKLYESMQPRNTLWL